MIYEAGRMKTDPRRANSWKPRVIERTEDGEYVRTIYPVVGGRFCGSARAMAIATVCAESYQDMDDRGEKVP